MKLAWRLFRRDLHAGELTLLLAALILAVAATTTLRFFSSSLEQALSQQAARLLGADLVLTSSRGLRPHWSGLARELHLRQAQTLEFSTMAQQGEHFQLSAVKAVGPGYPLRGELQLQGRAGPPGIPAPGTVWVEPRLLQLLDTRVGQPLTLGDATFTIAAVIAADSDRAGGFSALAPRVLLNLADVPATHAVQPGSRIQYRLLLAGPRPGLQRFQTLAAPRLQVDERLRDLKSASRQLNRPMRNAGDYLSLAAIASVLLSGIAVALAVRRYGERHLDGVALMRSLGASRRQLAGLFGAQLGLVWLGALLAGGLIGLAGSKLLFALLGTLLPVDELEFAILAPLTTGLATATLTLAGFALPAFLRLYRVSPLRVLRRDLSPPPWSAWAVTGLALSALFILLALETGNLRLTALVLAGGLGLTVLLGGLCHALLAALRHRPGPGRASLARDALAALGREPRTTVAQVLGLALGLTAVLLVGVIRTELWTQWRQDLPVDMPNHFAVTIPADQADALKADLRRRHWPATPFYPIVRGRLTAINGRAPDRATPADAERDDTRDNVLDRELNLTWSAELPTTNRLSAGQWFQGRRAEVSLEDGLAKRLHIGLGDRVQLQLAEGMVEATVTSLRTVDWDSFQPNFYLIFPPHLLADYPATYLTSFHVPPADQPRVGELVRRYPTTVFIDIAAMLAEVQQLLAQVARGLGVILLYTVAAGVLVLLASIAASLDQRRQEAALLRALGASRRQLRARAGAELALLGLLAGLLAVVMTELIAAALAVHLLDSTPRPHPVLWLATPLLSAVLTATIGLLGLRRVWTVSPLAALRAS